MQDADELFIPSEYSQLREHTEYREVVRTADWLRGEIHKGKSVYYAPKPFPDIIFTHFPAESGDATSGFFAKRMGLHKGVFDFIFWWATAKTGFIEMKADGRGMKPAQIRFDTRMNEMGFTNRALCYRAEQVRDNLIKWGIPYNDVPIPQRKITHAEALAFQREMYRP